ncbi:MAG TPA: hypothetical protein PKD48_02135 [Sphingopyxis sp.]|nr:hypothetical protein [Sphingopyxis sp.]
MAFQTPPDTAMSNASLWVEKVAGVAPIWLQAESIDTWVTIFLSMALGALLLATWQTYLGRRFAFSKAPSVPLADTAKLEARRKVEGSGARDLPDLPILELVDRLAKASGVSDDGSLDAVEAFREIAQTISDQMALRRLKVWGRMQNGTLQALPFTLAQQRIGAGRYADGKIHFMITHNVGLNPIYVNDIHFLRREIDEIWPDDPR